MMEKKHQGCRNELIACSWLLGQGYEVFRNVSQHGQIDLVALKDGEIFYFDVKSTGLGKSEFGPKLKQRQVDAGVRPIYVRRDGSCHIDWLPASIEMVREPRDCGRCGEQFKPGKDWQKFCSKRCRVASFKASVAVAGSPSRARTGGKQRGEPTRLTP